MSVTDRKEEPVKKRICLTALYIHALLTLFPARARAEGAAITAIYAAPKAQIITEADGSKSLAETLLFLCDDGSYRQYVNHGGKSECYSLGTYSLTGSDPVILTLVVRELHQPDHSMAHTNFSFDLNLSEQAEHCLYQAENGGAGISGAFMRADGQKLAKADGSETYLPTLWLYFEDGSFRQYALLDGDETVLFSTGDYTLSGNFEETESSLLIHRTQKYADGAGLSAYDSTHAYSIEELGYLCVWPGEEAAPLPLLPAFHETPANTDYSGDSFDEGVYTGIRITGYTKSTTPTDYFLSSGDKVAVLSPSALPGQEQAAATVKGLRDWGFEPVEGKYVYSELRTLEECVEDFRWALEDPEIKAIFCIRGGYGATEVMDALPMELIEKGDKPIIGFSDITAYHGAWTCAGIPSLHACMSGAFASLPGPCAEAEINMMSGEIPAYECDANESCRPGTAEGVLIGGNLSTFVASLDTAYDCTKLDEPYILFLEEVGENMQHIHRYLTVLKHRGILDRAAGIVFGEWTNLPADGRGNYGETRGGLFRSVADMICRQILGDTDIPIAFGFPGGHGDYNYPLLMGAKARLEVGEKSYTLSWE